MRFAAFASALLAVAVLAVAGPAASAPSAPSAKHAATATTVTVTATEFKFKLSRTSVPHGVVTFKLVNKGALSHDFKINGKKTPVIAKGKTATVKVTFAKAGKYPYKCTVDGHAAAGMKGTLKVT